MSKAWPVSSIKPKATVRKNARRILQVRIDELFSYSALIPQPELVQELHDARIAAKRLRYTLELFDFVFGKSGEDAIDELKDIQDLFGQIHDLDVRIDLIEGELARESAAGEEIQAGLKRLVDRQRSSREQMHRAMATRWQTLTDAGFEQQLREVGRQA